jgi:hypothetical protein
MLICVPYTRIVDATQVFTSFYEGQVKYVKLHDDWDYTRYFQERWDAGQTFINLEHDTVPWPGAPEVLWACEKPWCVFGYTMKVEEKTGSSLGCTKFSAVFMAQLPNVWQDMLVCGYWPENAWAHCDSWLYDYATKRGIRPHLHLPSVLNANPRYLGQPRPGP